MLTKHTLRFYDTGRLWISLDCLQITQIQQTGHYLFPKIQVLQTGGDEGGSGAGENDPKASIDDGF